MQDPTLTSNTGDSDVARLDSEDAWRAAEKLLTHYGLTLERSSDGEPIPGSHWGAPEAGLLGDRVVARSDTPVHSLLHEACHQICMDGARRRALDTDAGGEDIEEAAVCYLSIVLSEEIPGFGQARMLADMDRWGYSYRLGSARAWFERDAEDARTWLEERRILSDGAPTWERVP